jgi:hypothetical protein
MPFDEPPETLEIGLLPVRIDDEIAGHAVALLAGGFDGLDGSIDGGVLVQLLEPFVGGRFETEEDVEDVCDRPPRFEQLGVPRDQVGPALDEDPSLANPALLQRGRQLEAAGRLIPEQIVGNEVRTRLGKI